MRGSRKGEQKRAILLRFSGITALVVPHGRVEGAGFIQVGIQLFRSKQGPCWFYGERRVLNSKAAFPSPTNSQKGLFRCFTRHELSWFSSGDVFPSIQNTQHWVLKERPFSRPAMLLHALLPGLQKRRRWETSQLYEHILKVYLSTLLVVAFPQYLPP